MNYADVISSVANSDAPEDWKRVETDQGFQVAFLKEDVNIRIENSMEDQHIHNPHFKPLWNFPDPSARSYYYDLYYCATLLHRFILISVDGGRALLPLPRTRTGTASLLTYRVAQVFDSGDFEEYFRRSGLVLEDHVDTP